MEVQFESHPYSDPRWHEFYQHIGQNNPSDPRYVAYLKEKAAVERGEVNQEGQAEPQQVLDGLDRQISTDPELTQEDLAAVEEMLAMVKDVSDSKPEFKSNEEIERAFADGKI